MEQVLGIHPVAEGFSQTVIRPDLIDLKWARGQEPTPHGLLKVDLRDEKGDEKGMDAAIDLPQGARATVLFPVASGANRVLVNGKPRDGKPAEDGTRLAIVLDSPGHYELRAQ
jgi:hypothetical protein